MHLSPLKLDNYYFTEVRISCQSDSTDEESDQYDFEVDTDATLERPDQPRVWFVFLTITINGQQNKTPRFTGEIGLMGKFTVDDGWAADRIEELVYINGSGLLYAAAREMICSITGRTFFEALTIPSWSFGTMYKEFKQQQKQIIEKQAQLSLQPPANPAGTVGEPTPKPADPPNAP